MRETLAKLTTNALNPFLASFIIMVLFAFKDTDSTGEALKWASISIALSVLPVLALVIFMVRRKKLDGIFNNTRQQRTRIYVFASVLGATGYVVLRYGGGPELLVVTFAAGLAAVVVFMVINLFWKLSLHTALIAGVVAVLVMVYGAMTAWTILLLPPVAWARMKLKQHSIMQVGVAAILAAGIVVGIFWGYGISLYKVSS